MKKLNSIFWVTMALAIITLLGTACGGSTQEQAQPPAAGNNSSPAGEKITLKVWSHQNPAFNQVNQAIIDKFVAEHPNIEVKYETFLYEQYIQTLQTAMSAGTEADVIELFGTWACSYTGRLLEVPAEVMTYDQAKEIFYQAPLDGYYCDGKLYGLPNEFNLENGGVLVNPDLFAKHGLTYPPQWKTFADLVADAKKMTEWDGQAIVKAGFHFTNDDALAFTFLAGILQQGGDYFAADGQHFNLDTPEARQVVQLMVDLVQKEKVDDPVTFNNTTNPLPDAFFAGNAAIGFIGSWAAGEGRINFPETRFDYVTIPPYFGTEQRFSADSGWGKVVSAKTQHPVEAWQLARFMTAEQENALAFNSATGTIPAMKAIVANPDQLLEQAPWIKPTFDLLPHGRYVGDLTDRDQLFYQIIAPHLHEALQGTTTVEAVVQQIQAEANAMVDAKK